MNLNLHVTCLCIHTFNSLYFVIYWYCWCFSACFFLSLFLLLVALWHLNENLLCHGTLFIPGHLLLLLLFTPLPFISGFVMRKPNRTSWRTFHDMAFIRNAKSFCQIFSTLTYPLLYTVGVRSHCVVSRSCALLWSYKSSISICRDLIIL